MKDYIDDQPTRAHTTVIPESDFTAQSTAGAADLPSSPRGRASWDAFNRTRKPEPAGEVPAPVTDLYLPRLDPDPADPAAPAVSSTSSGQSDGARFEPLARAVWDQAVDACETIDEQRKEIAIMQDCIADFEIDLREVELSLDRLGIPPGILSWRLGYLEGGRR